MIKRNDMTKKKLAQGIVKSRYVLLVLMAVCTVLSALSSEKQGSITI